MRNLSIGDTIVQSVLIHPDWTPEMHRSYLINDAFFDERAVPSVERIDQIISDVHELAGVDRRS